MAEKNSKDLLKLEANTAVATTSTSSLDSKLFVCKKKDSSFSLPGAPIQKPSMVPVPKSNVLGKVHDFLGVLSESNKKLMQDAKDNPENYDIEVLNGKESEYIEMAEGSDRKVQQKFKTNPQDLMLGLADLNTPEAVAAAESAMAGHQPLINLSESEDSSSDKGDDEEEEDSKINEQNHEGVPQSVKFGSKDAGRDSSSKHFGKQKPKKRTKIIELS